MGTTIRIDEAARDRLRSYKDARGMTYTGAILNLVEEVPETHNEDEEGNEARVWRPTEWFREGANGASEYVMSVLETQYQEPDKYRPTVNTAVWDTYAEVGVEPRISDRTGDPSTPNLSDLIDTLSENVNNPSEHTIGGSDYEIELLVEEATDVLRALATYQKVVGRDDIPLESGREPTLSVSDDRTYEGEQRDGVNRVTADGEDLDPRSDLNHGVTSMSWGYAGSGPKALATAILADAYSDRYAHARSKELYDNFTSRLSTGEDWEITAGELDEYLNESWSCLKAV